MASRRLFRRRQFLAQAIERLEERRMLSAPEADDYTPYEGTPPVDPNHPAAYQLANRWINTASGSAGSTGQGITLTWSMIPDGVALPTQYFNDQGGPSDLQAKLDALYGASSNWLPVIQHVFDEWSSISGITFVYQPTDDGAAFFTDGQLGVRGDIRIGGHKINGTFGVLAYNFFPDSSDMVIDTDDLGAGGYMNDTTNDSRKLRNVMAHEIGHGLGFNHVDPINQTKLMEANAPLNPLYDGPQYDDTVAVNRYYGDFYEKGSGDNSAATAVDQGTLANGTDDISAAHPLSIATTADTDYYKFTISSTKEVAVTLAPNGPAPYLSGPQGGSTTLFDGKSQMDLQLQLLQSNGTTVMFSANNTGVGGNESFDFGQLAAGTYYIKVMAASGAADQAQMYTLSAAVGNAVSSTTTVALDGSNNLTVTDSAGGGKNDALTVTADAANSRFVISDTTSFIATSIGSASGNNSKMVYVPFGPVTGPGVIISTLAGTDTINVTSGAKPFTIDAGTGTDTINIVETTAGIPAIISSSAGGDAVNINADSIGTAQATFPVSQTIGALTIGSGGLATLAGTNPNPPAEVLVVTSVAITGTGKLNLVNNDLIVNYSGSSPLGTWNNATSITGLITSGRNSGAWNGNGIYTSMTAASAANAITTLGVAEASLALNISGLQTGSFDSQTVDATSVLVKYTLGGDANLNGAVNGDDYFRIDSGYPSQAAGWFNGDFDYNGKTNADDYFRIDYDYNKGATPLFAPLPLSVAAAAPGPSTNTTEASAYITPSASLIFADDPSAYQRLIEQTF